MEEASRVDCDRRLRGVIRVKEGTITGTARSEDDLTPPRRTARVQATHHDDAIPERGRCHHGQVEPEIRLGRVRTARVDEPD